MIVNSNLFYPIVVSIITGISWIAYKHPNGYKNIFRVVLPIILLYSVGGICFNVGSLGEGINQLSKELARQPDASTTSIKFTADGLSKNFNMIMKIFIISLGVVGYMIFLYFLPSILEINHIKGNREKK